MDAIAKALYDAAFAVWNTLMEVAVTIFTTSPRVAAGGSPYSTVYTIYVSISDATVPIATVFFLIAIYKSVLQAPPEHQATRFLQDALRYCIILFIASQLWTIMGYIMDFTDGITDRVGAVGSYQLSMGGDLETIMEDCLEWPGFNIFDFGNSLKDLAEWVGCQLIFILGGLVLVVVMVASCLSIISQAFQRILKPLIILPFAGIAVALGAGSHESERSLYQYMKTFFGFCISGALMIICIKVGVSLTTNLVSFDLSGASNIGKCVIMTVQAAAAPIVIAGLVRGSDAVVQRMF